MPKFSNKPSDINERIGAKPVVCYPNINIEEKNLNILHLARKNLKKKNEIFHFRLCKNNPFPYL